MLLLHVMDARHTKRKCYDATYKLVVVSLTDQQSMRATAKEFGIDEKQLGAGMVPSKA